MTLYSRNKAKKPLYRLVAALPMLCVLTYTSALAEGSFLLQLGTYASQDEATRKWDEVKSAHGDIVGSLGGHVSEVMLPPDNVPTYRTQAGPVDSRKEAKKLCNALQAQGVECYVVETAFAATDLAPEMAGEVSPTPAAAVPAPPAQAAEVTQTPATTLKATSPAEQISSTPVAPLTVATAQTPVATAPSAPQAQVEPVAAAPKLVQQQKTIVASEREDANISPSEARKPSFFRGSFRYGDNDQASTSSAKETTTVASASDSDSSPGFFGRLFGRSSNNSKSSDAVKGDVEVSEAIRVPVSTNEVASAPHYEAEFHPAAETVQPEKAVLTTSAQMLWAQVSYFNSEKAAQAFERQFKENSPDLMGDARSRITHPFSAHPTRVSLRMGPFASDEAIKAICESASEKGKRCTTIRGASDYTTRKRYPTPLEAVDIPASGHSSDSQVASTATLTSSAPAAGGSAVSDITAETGVGGHLVNLGGFHTSQEAWDYWKKLQSGNPNLGDVHANITGALGSSSESKFRLRVGPLAGAADAENICKLVEKSGKSCTLVDAE